jgi:GNAT superfamily N-acetyltransferase
MTSGENASGGPAPWEPVEILDEREPLAGSALQVIEEMFPRQDRQAPAELRSEIAEKRLGLLAGYDFHLLAVPTPEGGVAATVAGVYLQGVNAGFVTYLASLPKYQGKRLARGLRNGLVEKFREDARREEYEDLNWVLGEVRSASPWLRRLVRHRGAIPFDLQYFHPGMDPEGGGEPYTLYRQPIGDHRPELPVQEVRKILYSIWRRAYRVRYPLEREGFRRMLDQLEGRDAVGPDPSIR